MAQSDPWAVIGQTGPHEPAPGGVLPGSVAPGGHPAGSGRSGLCVAVAVLCFISAALHLVWLAIAPSGSPTDSHVYGFPYQDANKAFVLLLFIGVGTLVLVRRSRVFGLGLAVALPVQWLAANPGNFRPSNFIGSASQVTAAIVFLCLELAVVAAAVPAAIVLRRSSPRRETPAEPSNRVRRRRIRLLCLGPGAVLAGGLWLASTLMSWRVDHYGVVDFGQTHTYYCCSFDADNSFGKAGAVGICAVVVAFAVAAALVRSSALSAAWLLGPGLFNAAGIPEALARAVLPRQSLFGWSWAERFPSAWATTTLLPGFWLGVAGTLVVIGTAWLRIRIDRSAHDVIEVR